MFNKSTLSQGTLYDNLIFAYEHIAPLYRTQLLRQATDLVVRMIGDPDAPPKGTLDPEILIWCDLADHLAEGRHIPGIFIIDPSKNIGEILTELIIIASASFINEYQYRFEYLPLSK